MAPEEYIGDFGETAIEGHAIAINVCEKWHKQYSANGFEVGHAPYALRNISVNGDNASG